MSSSSTNSQKTSSCSLSDSDSTLIQKSKTIEHHHQASIPFVLNPKDSSLQLTASVQSLPTHSTLCSLEKMIDSAADLPSTESKNNMDPQRKPDSSAAQNLGASKRASHLPHHHATSSYRGTSSSRAKSWPGFHRQLCSYNPGQYDLSDSRLFQRITNSIPSMDVLQPWIHENTFIASSCSEQNFTLQSTPVPRDTLVSRADAVPNNVPSLEEPSSWQDFVEVVESVQEAISVGIYPILIPKGSSGSYFCRNSRGDIVGVFKPKDEEPYGHLNPKWIKWLHRNLFPCCFGRSCIIPNLGYISEAAASFIDRRLSLNIVPRTEIVRLASPSFFYPYKDRWAFQVQGKPLPPKLGSFQIFVSGYEDATTFFREGYHRMHHNQTSTASSGLSPLHPFDWNQEKQDQFRYGFERMVILDYLIRNTDRSSDNWLVRWQKQKHSSNSNLDCGRNILTESTSVSSERDSLLISCRDTNSSTDTQLRSNPVCSSLKSCQDTEEIGESKSRVRVVAIDHGLAFPTRHPTNVRSYPYGWSFISLAHVPFSVHTAMWVLPYLTSPSWLDETLDGLELLFALDPDFKSHMWNRQKSVIRGQVYNLVQVLSSVIHVSSSQPHIPSSSSSAQSLDTICSQNSVPEVEESVRPLISGMSPYDLVQRPLVVVHEEPVSSHPLSTSEHLGLELETSREESGGVRMNPELSNSDDITVSGFIPLERHIRKPSFLTQQKRRFKKVKQRIETLSRRAFFSNW